MRWTGNITRTGQRGMHVDYWWESQKKRERWDNLNISGRILLKWILEWSNGIIWTGLIWLRIVSVVGCLEHGN
jgi:hypothetical protein